MHHILAQVAAEFKSLEANLRQSFRVLAQGRPRADVAELDGVSIASLGAAFQMFNAAFLNRRVAARAELEARLGSARQVFAARRLPWAFWICEEWLAWPARRALTGVCENFALRAAAEMPGMVADSLREPKRLPLAGRAATSLGIRRAATSLDIRRVATSLDIRRAAPALDIRQAEESRTMEDFRAVGSVCFHVPAVWFREVFDDAMPFRAFTFWVGYHDGRPVATAATVVSDGVIGLYNVATMPCDRGRGYGEAITRHAIADASRRSGLRRVILQSTAQGERLYKRLGFREVSRVVVFNSLLPQ